MLGAQALLGDARWIVALIGIALAGAVVYLPLLLAVGLTAGERVALTNAVGKLRARPAAG
jgi:hypothetical protein